MNTKSVQIRPLTPDDTAAYRDIRLEALRLSPEVFNSTFENESTQPIEWFADRLSRSDVVGAFSDEDILGIAGLLLHQGNSAHTGRIWGVYTRPSARRKGLGRKLVEAILEIARTKIEIVQLSVSTENEAACRLYTNLGFREFGLSKKSLKLNRCYYDEYLMDLDLNAAGGTGG